MNEILSSVAAESLDAEAAFRLFARHVQPGLARLLEIGGFGPVRVASAENHRITLEDGRVLVDLVSSYGALNLGHNPPRILATEARLRARRGLDLSKELPSPYIGALAANLARLAPGDLDVSFFSNSGAEAVEAGLRLAERAFRGRRPMRIRARNAMHGKTRGAVALSGGAYAEHLAVPPGTLDVAFGDVLAVARALAENPGRVGVVVLEPIQGEAGAVVPPEGYLAEVRALCDENGALLLLDEIQTGLGRTGRLFACEEEGVVPDILVLAKSLGGGIASIGATLCSSELHRRAFRGIPEALVATSTFGGRATACAIGCDVLCETIEGDLPGRAADLGARLGAGLEEIARKRPAVVEAVRGRGFLRAIILRPGPLPAPFRRMLPGFEGVLGRHLPGLVAAELFAEGYLASPMLQESRALRIYPPLTLPECEIEPILSALDRTLALGIEGLLARRLERLGAARFLSGAAAFARDAAADAVRA